MIASLGMYDRAETCAANDRYWALIRDGLRQRGIGAPEGLTRGEAAYWPAWQSDSLVLSQTCGLPYRSRLQGHVTLIGTPDFGVTDCPPGYYCSVFVARATDRREGLAAFSGSRFAYNEDLSQSGWAAPQTHAAARGISLPPFLQTGGHLQSLRAVAEGDADLAALDAVSWAMFCRWEADAARLRVVERTAPTPGLPYIAAAGADAGACHAAVAQAMAGLDAADRALLGLKGLVAIPRAAYLAVPIPPSPAQIVQDA